MTVNRTVESVQYRYQISTGRLLYIGIIFMVYSTGAVLYDQGISTCIMLICAIKKEKKKVRSLLGLP